MSIQAEIFQNMRQILDQPITYEPIITAMNAKGDLVRALDPSATSFSLAGAWVRACHGYGPSEAMEAWAILSLQIAYWQARNSGRVMPHGGALQVIDMALEATRV